MVGKHQRLISCHGAVPLPDDVCGFIPDNCDPYSDALSAADGPAATYLEMFSNNIGKIVVTMRQKVLAELAERTPTGRWLMQGQAH